MPDVSHVPRSPVGTGVLPPPASVIPVELQPEEGSIPLATSRRKSLKLGPVAVPAIAIWAPGLSQRATDGTIGRDGLVIANPGGLFKTTAESVAVLFRGLTSPPPLTEAVFTTVVSAFAPTFTDKVIGG